jgi:hypothetical protein
MSVQEEASRLAYAIGLRELTPFILRLLNLEATVERQKDQIISLQNNVMRLQHPIS